MVMFGRKGEEITGAGKNYILKSFIISSLVIGHSGSNPG
jgi:hypothetical protein